ncbi:MAG: hypothetical protein AUK35_10305 [Zetaproteobacteria bacterium CG2_30_46_52]|nr:MAG: hypothetical protein AUK35_10305 [Zetaproteobacteria bacterium CG2_30_46_52]
MKHLFLGVTFLGLGLISGSASAAVGETWHMTNEVVVNGMKFQVGGAGESMCLEKDAAQQLSQMMSQDGDCEVSDIKTSGDKTTWKMACDTDGENMQGNGEVVRTKSSLKGFTQLSGQSQGEPYTSRASFAGTRVGQACDTDAERFETPPSMAGSMDTLNSMMGMAQAQMQSGLQEQCQVSNYETKALISMRFFGKQGQCVSQQKYACKVISKDAFRDTESYIALAKYDDTSDIAISQVCGIDFTAATASICEKVDGDNYESLLDYCPKQAATFVRVAEQEKQTDSLTNNPITNTIDGVKKLKGMFNF